jgi:hypothetical protein
MIHLGPIVREAQLHRAHRQAQLDLLATGIRAFDAVLESLPEASQAVLWLADSIDAAERCKEALSG